MNTKSIVIESLARSPDQIEFVERKGIGHPDTICDQLAEQLSLALCRHYLEKHGTILHHNVDKALLVAGKSRPCFGGGEIIAPMEIFLTGRASIGSDASELDLDRLATDVAERWFRQHIPLLKSKRDLVVTPKIHAGSAELVELFGRNRAIPLANDTSFGVGYAPISPLEQLVLELETCLHSQTILSAYPCIGADTKAMGVRRGRDTSLTLAIAFIDRHVESLADYIDKKAALTELLATKASEIAAQPVSVVINAADNITSESIYLTVTGTSAESGDDGQVGRGNRHNGLITPFRPMSLEAIAGKNPVSHVGKIYNIFASDLARELYRNVEAIQAVNCYLVSTIGSPITEPQLVNVKADCGGPIEKHTLEEINNVTEAALARLPEFWKTLVNPNPV